MSLVPANITVNFIANYNGAHRICYRVSGSSGPYTCINTTCSLGACSGAIPIFVDNETCPTIQYEGYVQAECQDVNSLVDRIPFSVNFVPSQSCKLYTITCINVGVASATVTNAGTSYNPIIPPDVLVTGGSGSGATATATVGSGGIIIGSVNSITPGSGYNNGTFMGVNITGGSGSGGIATVVVSGGAVISITITNKGTGYQTANALGLNAVDMGGASPTIPAAFHIISDYGTILSINITNFGSGYTSVPTISIAASGGTQATATAILQNCPSLSTDGCTGGVVVIPSASLSLGTVVSACNVGGPLTPGSQFSVVQNGACICNCVRATIGVTGAILTQVRYFYNRCGAGVQSGLLTVGGSPSSIIDCIVPGSLIFEILTPGTIGTVIYGGSC